MRQFDISSIRGDRTSLVVILQHDAIGGLDTCVVAPLIPRRILPALQRLRPVIDHAGEDHVVAIDRVATVRRRNLLKPSGSVSAQQDDIKAALDLLFLGF